MAGARIGSKTIIDRGWYVNTPSKLVIGNHCHVNNNCMFDARGGLKIGDNVSISYNVIFESAGHDFQSPLFDYISAPIIIGDNVWIGLNVTILMGVEVGEGAVIASGAVVTKDCEPWGVYAGIPAKKIGERKTRDVKYNCTSFVYWKGIRKPYLR
jgi:acetyltransferase-like isoleucine patch superfamily enzyme